MMRDAVWSLVDAAEMRELDRYTIEELGVPGELLMESAGRAVTAETLRILPPGGDVVVACGSGNNGGDGYVVARLLHAVGVPVVIWALAGIDRLGGDAAANHQRAVKAGVPIDEAPPLGARTVVVDAIFGTGLSRAVAGTEAAAFSRIREARTPVVAVDLPSGLDANTGQLLGEVLEAKLTVTLGLPKIGLALEPGRSLAGRIVVARIGIADETPEVQPAVGMLTRVAAGARIPSRPASGHKGTFGHLLVVAASEGKTGAAALAAAGAHRVGAGLVTVACPVSTNPVLEAQCTEAMTAPLPETEARELSMAGEKAIVEYAEARSTLLVGPGVGRGTETLELVRRLAMAISKPLVLDADGIVAFADEPGTLGERGAATILTPQPGEAAMLVGRSAAELNRDRVGSARALAELTGSVVVLKGAGTVIAEPAGRAMINPTGGPVLGAGGTGDVLAGMVAGFLAQGLEAFDAASLAAFVHGAAADAWAAQHGAAGLLAHEVAAGVPAVLDTLRRASATGRFGAMDALDFPESR
jgi:NAD(P)H-hydrate epimerase